jgi:hypothetical protein
MRWRTIITDTEGLTGVGPECEHQAELDGPHDLAWTNPPPGAPRLDEHSVYDCCPLPHLECYSTVEARVLAGWLNAHEVGVCD